MINRLLTLTLLVLFLNPLNGWTQSSQSDSNNEVITPLYGSFGLKQAPIEFNLPDGFMYLDTETTKEILILCGNDASSLNNVIGMIIPDDTQSIFDIDKSWIISYDNPGHVKDNTAENMGFSWIVKNLRNSDEFRDSQIGWAWSPKYDSRHHLLSLPIMSVTGKDTVLHHRRYIFGNQGVVYLEPTASPSEFQWLYDNEELISNAINFSPGHRYEDFDSINQPYAYNSVTAFLRGIPASLTASLRDETLTKQQSSLPPFIQIIGYIGLSLVVLMLLLMLCVALTNKQDENVKDMLRSGINVLLRIGVFCMVYLLILTFAIFLVWAGVWITITILSHYISKRLLFMILGGWIIIGGFLWAIIKSLFIFSRQEYPNRLEIYQKDAPELFAIIEEVAHKAGEKMPKHVYVSPEVNAYVFFNQPFLSLFYPGRKNLEVGLGLLFGLNKQEFTAVIAHEYGHFGQKSMRIGQIISICYNIISNLVNADNAFIVRPILRKTFVYVQRGNMALSRVMEYEADRKSAIIAGAEATISALCKIDIMTERLNVYDNFVRNIYESKKILPSTYWKGYEQFLAMTDKFDGIILNETVTATAQLSKTPKSKVNLKNPWISHPLLEQRVINLRALASYSSSHDHMNIQHIVSPQVYHDSSCLLFTNEGYNLSNSCSDVEYKALLAIELDEKSFPLSMRVFFNRRFYKPEISTSDLEVFTKQFQEVFSDYRANIVESFSTAISDYITMVRFKNKQTTEKEIQYEGVVYNRKKVPVERQLEIVKGMEPQIISIDKDIYLLALAVAPDKELIKKAYNDIFHSQDVISHIENNILPLRDQVAKIIEGGGSKDEESFKRIQSTLLNFKGQMKTLIDQIEIDRLDPVIHLERAKDFKRIENDWLLNGMSIEAEEIQYIFSIPDNLISLFQNLSYYSKKIISDTIEGKTPLMYWNNSVASSKIDKPQ